MLGYRYVTPLQGQKARKSNLVSLAVFLAGVVFLEFRKGESMMGNSKTIFAAAAALSLVAIVPAGAGAATVYTNEGGNPFAGDCSFSTTCAADDGRGDEFAAQLFTLGSAVTVTGGSFTELDAGIGPTSVNYAFYSDVGGLPSGAALDSGSASITATLLNAGIYDQQLESFHISNVSLGAGSYFFAIQAVSSVFGTYLQQGVVTSGAAETNDGGLTWAAGYENLPGGAQLGGIAVALYSVPEPTTLAMMLLGFAGLGLAGYRKAKSATFSAA